MNTIRIASINDISNLYSLTSYESHISETGYFERCLDEQAQNLRDVMLVFDGDKLAGYCHFQRQPQYQPFRSLNIPEIQDLYIHPDYRQKGLAIALINACAQKTMDEGGDMIGLGVSVSSNYGKAQRLYVKMGFEPDGAGVVYERKAVMHGQCYNIDDDLCLMMIKTLK